MPINMYIKTDCKTLKSNDDILKGDNKENFDTKLQRLPHVVTPRSLRDQLNKYQQGNRRSPHTPPYSNTTGISSLNFLHKPQRVAHLHEGRFPEEELQRNTDLNKKLTIDKNLPDLCPRTIIEAQNLESVNYIFNNTSSDSLIPFQEPIFKKSGELVKSSLKKRSKSLPSTPLVMNTQEYEDEEETNPILMIRSKSVHFDHKTPVKYFSKDESPINVHHTDEHSNILNFIHKPVNLLDVGFIDSDELLLSGLDRMNFKDRFSTRNNLNKATAEPKKFRKSKRFNNLIGKDTKKPVEDIEENKENVDDKENNSQRKVSGSTTQNIVSSPAPKMTANPEIIFAKFDNMVPPNKVVGLYNENFPILSNKNPKSLKLNVFINLAQGKKCFLQELTLHMQNRQNLSNGNQDDNANNTVSRYIMGKVLVKNVYYDKRVIIRYTWNKWKTVNEVECIWLSNSDAVLPGINMDIFHFLIDDNCREDTLGKLEFCVHYTTRDDHRREEFWDNNNDNNYKVDVVLKGFNNPFGL